MEPDSNLPSASELAELLISRGHGQTGESLEDIAERLVLGGGWQSFTAALPRADWRVARCNEAHTVLAELCREGLVRRVLTTNWDTLVEAALRNVGLAYAPIVNAAALATEPPDTVAVIKLHGCIDHPESLKAARSEIESPTWANDWAAALFETLVRSNSILFVGYSGSARAATHTIAKIIRAGDRSNDDYLVDKRSYTDLQADGVAASFVEALALTVDRFRQLGATEFFRNLREGIFPLLLERPLTESRSLLQALCAPTRVDRSQIEAELIALRERWAEAGPLVAQEWLRSTFTAFPECRATHSYLSLSQRKSEIGRCLAWIALALWAGAVRMDSPNANELDIEVLANGESPTGIPCVIAVCLSSDRRDTVAYQATMRRSTSGAAPLTPCVGVLFGGVGPDPRPTRDFSVARGLRRGSVARTGSVLISWTDGERLFQFFEPEAEGNVVAQRVKDDFRLISRRLADARET